MGGKSSRAKYDQHSRSELTIDLPASPTARPTTPQATDIDGRRKSPPLHQDAVTSVKYCGNPWEIVSGSRNMVVARTYWNSTHGKGSTQISCHTRAITQVLFCKETRQIYSCSRDKTVCQWLPGCNIEPRVFDGHKMAVTGVALCGPGSHRLVSGSRDGTLCSWDSQQQTLLRSTQIARNVITSLKQIADTSQIIQASEDKMLRIWDTNTLTSVVTFPRQQYIHTCCDASNDENTFLTGSSGLNGNGCTGMLWDRRSVKPVGTLVGHGNAVTSCCFLPPTTISSSPMVATASQDSSIRIWSSHNTTCVAVTHVSHVPNSLDAVAGPGGAVNIVAGLANGDVLVLGLRVSQTNEQELVLDILGPLEE
eukprot:m.36247 g.36247  ORF g.36247 m.36247 type:complete len:366 (-) comp17312_c0_seq1:107-1204(-)